MTQPTVHDLIAQAKAEQWEELDLSGMELFTIPLELAELEFLKTLNLSQNKLNDFFNQVQFYLPNLENLNLSYNGFDEIPQIISQLGKLKSLNISGNNVNFLPDWFSKLNNFQSLNLSTNKLLNLPNVITGLRNVELLNLNNNYLVELPTSISSLNNLRYLSIRNNEFQTVPSTLCELTELLYLDIGYNQFTQLPEDLSSLTKIEYLYLSGLNLRKLPSYLLKLRSLAFLYLDNNLLSSLPNFIQKINALQSLDLRANKLKTLSKGLTKLEHLEYLYLSDNLLTELPKWLVDIPRIKKIYIQRNPIANPSPETLGRSLTYGSINLNHLKRYYEQLEEAGEVLLYEAKLLVIGEGGAGKTTFARKLTDEQFSPSNNKSSGSTDGIEIINWEFELSKKYKDNTYRVNIWDFGGQEIYFATHQFFLTKRSVYVLVTDTRKQHTDFYTWLRMQEAFGADSPTILLKNKNRSHGNRFYIDNLPQIQKRFSNLKEIIEIDLLNVPKEQNWNLLLQKLKSHLLNLEHVQVPRPRTWVDTRQFLQETYRDVISWEEFLVICFRNDIDNENDAEQLSEYLHHLGDILHFSEDPILRDIVILKPTWGLDAVYKVLDNENILNNWGQFTYSQLRDLWSSSKYQNHHHQLLRLMQKFQLCYPIENIPDTYIAPQLLADEVPEYKWDNRENVQLRYRYPVFMPRGILSRAIVLLHERIEEQRLVWRSGVILRNEFARAELLELRGDSEIRIRVSGKVKRDLLMEIVRALEKLHRGFPKLRYEKLIPCNCSTCGVSLAPHFYPLDKLMQRLANKKRTIECDQPPYEDVQILGLLDDLPPELTQDPRNPIVHNYYGDTYNSDIKSESTSVGRESRAGGSYG